MSDLALLSVPSTRRPSALLSLPSELILEIFSHYASNTPTKPGSTPENALRFYPLALVCKRLHPFAMSFIYAEYSESPDNLTPFLLNPSLWKYVQKIEFPWIPEVSKFSPATGRFPLLPVIQEFALEEAWPEALFEGMCMGSIGVDNFERAAIMCHARNVRELSIGLVENPYEKYMLPSLYSPPRQRSLPSARNKDQVLHSLDPILYAARGQQFGNVHRFENLHTLRIDMRRLVLKQISSIFRLPSLRVLALGAKRYLTFTELSEGDISSWEFPPGTSSIQCLEIHRLKVEPSDTVLATQSCRALKSFVHSELSFPSWEGQYSILLEVARQHKDSLQELKVYNSRCHNYKASLGDALASLIHLQRLELPFGLLTGDYDENSYKSLPFPCFDDLTRVLPTSLVHLSLDISAPYPPPDSTTKAFRNILSSHHHQTPPFPNLKTIDLVVRISDVETPLPMDFVLLDRLFAEHDRGIKFTYNLNINTTHGVPFLRNAFNYLSQLPDGMELVRHSEILVGYKEFLMRTNQT
ncbi:hypothetical protein K505DRAFT_31155 [Melanomma pulvis-pyrius CBS 109.77]|uniref:F-box domain-containing protein n=1 Tax=Melanomma pulvis-pyrius CBS 109.77 TaxID=1314802 RepID=A0A6A6XCS2_9PLEO|nr:hypothetical protein K505DRAFT_31155 [Melanomma pulvis-pyrius CBS 109.77]